MRPTISPGPWRFYLNNRGLHTSHVISAKNDHRRRLSAPLKLGLPPRSDRRPNSPTKPNTPLPSSSTSSPSLQTSSHQQSIPAHTTLTQPDPASPVSLSSADVLSLPAESSTTDTSSPPLPPRDTSARSSPPFSAARQLTQA